MSPCSPLRTGKRISPTSAEATRVFIRSGLLLYALRDALFAVPFDLSRLQVTVRTSVGCTRHPAFWESQPSPRLPQTRGRGQRHIGVPGRHSGGGSALSLVWVDRRGTEQALNMPRRTYLTYPRISPDGTRLALDIRDQPADI
jgi:hypothetical protein